MNERRAKSMGEFKAVWLGELVDRLASTLELYARQLCDDPSDAVQEALIELVRQPKPPENVAAWLFRVVRNKALSQRRSSDRRTVRERVAGEERPGWFEDAPTAALTTAEVEAALQTLPLDEREVIVAHLWGRQSFEEIGKLQSVSASTAHRRYQLGLTRMRERLGVPCPTDTKTK